jgi:hypothetical protein
VRTCGRRDVRLPIDAPWPSGSKLSREHTTGQSARSMMYASWVRELTPSLA